MTSRWIWCLLGMFLLVLDLCAWTDHTSIKRIEMALLSSTGEAGDSILHMTAVFGTVGWLSWGRRIWHLRRFFTWWMPIPLTGLLSVCDETVQLASSERTADLQDLATDGIALAIASVILFIGHRKRVRTERRSQADLGVHEQK